MGDTEILKADAVAFAERLKSLGNICELDLWPDMMFMFQMADEFFHESHLAMDRVGFELTKERNIDSGKFNNLPKLENSLKQQDVIESRAMEWKEKYQSLAGSMGGDF